MPVQHLCCITNITKGKFNPHLVFTRQQVTPEDYLIEEQLPYTQARAPYTDTEQPRMTPIKGQNICIV